MQFTMRFISLLTNNDPKFSNILKMTLLGLNKLREILKGFILLCAPKKKKILMRRCSFVAFLYERGKRNRVELAKKLD